MLSKFGLKGSKNLKADSTLLTNENSKISKDSPQSFMLSLI